MNTPSISIVLPTYNRKEQLKRVLAALVKQNIAMDDFEVVVVSDGSIDGTNEYLASLEMPFKLVIVFQDNQGVAVARNSGVSHARSELILFIDDDVVADPNLISEHLRTHARMDGDSQRIAKLDLPDTQDQFVVLGPMLTPPDVRLAPWVRWEQKMLEKQYQSMTEGRWAPTARQFYTGNTSLARSQILDAGGFDPAFRRAEDVELAFRLKDRGARFIFNPQAIGYHYAERSFNSWLNIAYAYGRNDVIMAQQKDQAWLLPTIMDEFSLRHPLIRGLTHLCLDRPRLSRGAVGMLEQIAGLGDLLNIEPLPRFAYSGIFNLRHYQGVADELGGADKFWELQSHGG